LVFHWQISSDHLLRVDEQHFFLDGRWLVIASALKVASAIPWDRHFIKCFVDGEFFAVELCTLRAGVNVVTPPTVVLHYDIFDLPDFIELQLGRQSALNQVIAILALLG